MKIENGIKTICQSALSGFKRKLYCLSVLNGAIARLFAAIRWNWYKKRLTSSGVFPKIPSHRQISAVPDRHDGNEDSTWIHCRTFFAVRASASHRRFSVRPADRSEPVRALSSGRSWTAFFPETSFFECRRGEVVSTFPDSCRRQRYSRSRLFPVTRSA